MSGRRVNGVVLAFHATDQIQRCLAGLLGELPVMVVDVVASAFALWRLRRVELAPAAAGVAAHSWVDVYWVLGTPVLGWLPIGTRARAGATT